MADLSATQAEALEKAKAAGKLVRWRGGFWTIPNCAIREYLPAAQGGDIPVPIWHVGVGTIQALKRRGLLVVTATSHFFDTEVQPATEGTN